jgi:putative autotransporter adhesin-like protein
MKKLILFTLVFGLNISSLWAQEKETRSLARFSEISVGEAINLFLIPGSKNEAVVEVEGIDLKEVHMLVRGDRLNIDLAGNRHRNVEVNITLTYKSINEISVSSAASVTTNGPVKTDKLNITVASAGYAKLDVVTEELEIDVSSSGELELTGVTTSQRVEVASAGDYRSYDLNCEDVYVRASSAGSARVYATKKIDAEASSAGSIKYRGNPAKVYLSSNSAGSVKKSN